MKKLMMLAAMAIFCVSMNAQEPQKKECCKKEKTECCERRTRKNARRTARKIASRLATKLNAAIARRTAIRNNFFLEIHTV